MTLLLSGCSVISTYLPSKKAAAPEILIYSALDPVQSNYLLPSFKQMNPGLIVNIFSGSDVTIAQKVLAERSDPKADVLWGVSAAWAVRLQAEGLLDPIMFVSTDKLNEISTSLRDGNDPPTWIGTNAYLSVFCVNSSVLSAQNLKMPTSWLDLIDPSYQGKLVLPNPVTADGGYSILAGLIQEFSNSDKRGEGLRKWATDQGLQGEAAAWAFWDALNKNVASYSDSSWSICASAADGRIPIGISTDMAAVEARRKSNSIVIVFPKEGSGWDVQSVALPKKVKSNPNASLFIDWALSQETMLASAHFTPLTSVTVSAEIPSGYISNPLQQLQPVNLVWGSANRQRIVEAWAARYQGSSAAAASAGSETISTNPTATPSKTPSP